MLCWELGVKYTGSFVVSGISEGGRVYAAQDRGRERKPLDCKGLPFPKASTLPLTVSVSPVESPPSLKIQSACASRLPSVPISLQPPNSSIASSLSLSSLCFLVYSGH